MATHIISATVNPTHWSDLDGTITSIGANLVVITNTDGTLTHLIGNGFAGNVGTNTLTAGTIVQMERRDATGAALLEQITGVSPTWPRRSPGI